MTEEQYTLYDAHLNYMMGNNDIYYLTDYDIEAVINNLIKCLPNGGKLYKYRKIDDANFNNTINPLKEDYLWLTRADTFKDCTDGAIHFDAKYDVEQVEKFLKENPRLIFNKNIFELGNYLKDLEYTVNDELLSNIVDCFDEKTLGVDIEKGLQICKTLGYPYDESKKALEWINEKILKTLQVNEDLIKLQARMFVDMNKNYRHSQMVCSLCEDYKVKSMWDNYADGNGICIEYDYNKLQKLSPDNKRYFCSTFKVIYADDVENFSFVDTIIETMQNPYQKGFKYRPEYRILNMGAITKSTDYDKEHEWRIRFGVLKENEHLVHDNGIELYADIISGIIFDEKALNTNNGKEILKLCQERGWDIKVRMLNYVGTHYNYKSYVDYENLINKSII